MKKILAVFAIALFASLPALAGTIHPLGFPEQVANIGQKIDDLYSFIFIIVSVIMLLVTVLIGVCIWKFRASRNKKPATFSHNNTLEVIWTVIPAIICIALAWQSFVGMKYIRTMPDGGVTVEVIGYQFGWDFSYPDYGFDAPLPTEPHQTLSIPGQDRYVPRMVVPVGVPTKVHVTSRDVIHAYYTPEMGVKIDAMPGRINYQWFTPDTPGVYIGQCAELCGSAHGEMFYEVEVKSQADFIDWVAAQRRANGLNPMPTSEITALWAAAE